MFLLKINDDKSLIRVYKSKKEFSKSKEKK